MPDPPDVDIVTRLVFENPWPVAALAAAIGIGMLLSGLRDGVLRRVHLSAIPLAVAAGIVALGAVVTTSGERAEVVVLKFVENVVAAAPITRTTAVVAPDATLHMGSERNAGLDADAIRAGVARAMSYAIESNRVTALDAYSVRSDRAVVHLACRTDAGWGPVVTRWVLHLEDRGGNWLITRLVFVEVNGNTPRRF